jgi:predicted glycosyltransferase
MSVLFDINHPAHVHYFKHVIFRLKESGHKVVVVARDKDVSLDLLEAYSIPFINRGKGGNDYMSRAKYHVKAIGLIRRAIKKNGIKLVVSFMHPYGAQAAYLSGVKSIAFTDTENATLHHYFTVPFLDKVFSPEFFKADLGKKHVRFPGFMESAHLHPANFTLQTSIRKELMLQEHEEYCILRFVSRKSLHDVRHPGLTDSQKIKIVDRLSKVTQVLISSEVSLPKSLEKYQIRIEPHDMHSVLSGATLFFGESATMASEAALLGVPSIYIDDTGRGYTDELENRFKMVKRFVETEIGLKAAIDESEKFLTKSSSFFDEREKVPIDFKLSDYMYEVIANYL